MTYPILLAHGICRFDHIANWAIGLDNQDDDRGHYFRKIRTALMAEGHVVYHSRVEWAASVDVRALSLRRCVEDVLARSGADRLHIIAHSMGGLDSRHMLYDFRNEGMAEKVASLSTVATPHHGCGFADWGARNFGRIIDGLAAIGLTLEGIQDLTTNRCAAFNQVSAAFEDACGVRFHAYAGTWDLRHIFAPLKGVAARIQEYEGDNDGLVPLSSARWCDNYFRLRINADHLNIIGWCHLETPTFLEESPAEFEARIQKFYCDIASRAVNDD